MNNDINFDSTFKMFLKFTQTFKQILDIKENNTGILSNGSTKIKFCFFNFLLILKPVLTFDV